VFFPRNYQLWVTPSGCLVHRLLLASHIIAIVKVTEEVDCIALVRGGTLLTTSYWDHRAVGFCTALPDLWNSLLFDFDIFFPTAMGD
jgi:hypothetical protein